jgi:DNA-binding transcriptional regulator YiaG
MTTKWKELRSELEAQPGIDDRRKRAREALEDELASFVGTLPALRRRTGFNQVELAKQLGITQAQVSNFERQEDMLLSTLRRYIEALGGELHIVAAFPNSEDVTIIVGKELLGADDK